MKFDEDRGKHAVGEVSFLLKERTLEVDVFS